MTVLVKTESSVKKLVWVPDGYINRRPPTTGGEIQSKRSSSYSRRGGGGRRPRRPDNGGDYDIVYFDGFYIFIPTTGGD